MRRMKARPGDEALIHDEREDWVERSSALMRLLADGRRDLEPVARQWLKSDEPSLASEALGVLLIYWRESPRIYEYVTHALHQLATADAPEVRSSAATSLRSYVEREPQFLDEIIPALLRALESDDDEFVQQACYMALLWQIDREEALKFPRPGVYHFNRDTDVRWDLLAPLRERYGKPRC
jgi:HEAT repeat protein